MNLKYKLDLQYFATSGTRTFTYLTYWYIKINWVRLNINSARTTSDIKVDVYWGRTASGTNEGGSRSGTLTVHGSNSALSYTTALTSYQEKLIGTRTRTVAYDSNGDASFNISASIQINLTLNGTYLGTVSPSMSVTLDNVPPIPPEPTKYTANFSSNGGSPSYSSQTVTSGGTIYSPGEPTRTGYVFNGWSPSLPRSITANTTFTAQWYAKSWYAYFNADGGSPTPSTQTVPHGSTISTPVAPIKFGYLFYSWSPSTYTQIIGNTTFTAIWTPKKYTVTFNSNGGTYVSSQQVNHNEYPTYPANPTKVGFIFQEWSPYFYSEVITYDKSFTAIWKENVHVVTYNTAGGNIIPVQEVKHNEYAVNPPDPTRVGHTFNGWSPVLGGAITAPTTYTAQWVPIDYTVSFNSDGAGYVPTQSVAYGQKATAPTDPAKDNYIFLGWSPDIETTTITGNQVFKALWTFSDFTVTFNTMGGLPEPDDQVIPYLSKAIMPIEPIKEQYVFTGWLPSLDTVVTSAINFVAQWADLYNTAKFNTAGGLPLAGDQIIKYGELVTPPEIPSKTGYAFGGWEPLITDPVVKNTTYNVRWVRIIPPIEVKFDTEITINLDNNKVSSSKIYKSESYKTNIILDFSDTETTGMNKYANVTDTNGELFVYDLGIGDIVDFWLTKDITHTAGKFEVNPMATSAEQKALFQTFRFEILEAIDNSEDI